MRCCIDTVDGSGPPLSSQHIVAATAPLPLHRRSRASLPPSLPTGAALLHGVELTLQYGDSSVMPAGRRCRNPFHSSADPAQTLTMVRSGQVTTGQVMTGGVCHRTPAAGTSPCLHFICTHQQSWCESVLCKGVKITIPALTPTHTHKLAPVHGARPGTHDNAESTRAAPVKHGTHT